MEQSSKSNPGKMLSIVGFIIGLTGIIGGAVVFVIAFGQAAITGGGMMLPIGLAVYTLIGFVMSFIGRKKSKASGNKGILGMLGMLAGIAGIGISIATIILVDQVQSASGKVLTKTQADSAKVQMDNSAQHMIDSMNAANNAGGSDSTHK